MHDLLLPMIDVLVVLSITSTTVPPPPNTCGGRPRRVEAGEDDGVVSREVLREGGGERALLLYD